MRKYVDTVVNALIYRDKLFNRYIVIPHAPPLLRIMDGFFHACGLPNVCGTIDGSHIPLSQKLDKWVIAKPTYYNCKQTSYNYIVLQGICNMDKLFWNVCCLVRGGTTNGGQFKMSFIHEQLQTRSILREPIVVVESLEIKPYFLGDVGYAS